MGSDDAKDPAEMNEEVEDDRRDAQETAYGEERGDADGGGKKKKNYRKKGGEEDAMTQQQVGGCVFTADGAEFCAAPVCVCL